MKKLTAYLIVFAMLLTLMIALSGLVFADQDGDIDWGGDYDKSGYWGFTYIRYAGDEVGEMKPYFHIDDDRIFQKVITGAFIDDGQEVTTTIGQVRSSYSPFAADFHDGTLGLRISDFELDLGDNQFAFDGTYIFGFADVDDLYTMPVPIIDKPSDQAFTFNVSGNIDDLGLNLTTLRYLDDNDENQFNSAVEVDLKLIDDLNLDGVYAFYTEDAGFLYEVNMNYKVNDDLSVRAGHRNSEDLDFTHIKGANNRYVDSSDVNDIWKRDNSVNAGFTLDYNLPDIENTLKVDFDSTNPGARDNLDSTISSTLDTDAFGFSIKQDNLITIPDDEADSRTLYHRARVISPDFDIPGANVQTDFLNVTSATITGMASFVFDRNYDVGEDYFYTLAGAHISLEQRLWRLSGLRLDFNPMLDISGADNGKDLFKFTTTARYQAPNEMRFTVQYFSSDDYASPSTDNRNRSHYSMYEFLPDDDSFDVGQGIRVMVGIPY